MKTLHVQHQIEGPAHELAMIRQRRIDAVRKKTLGQVIGELTENGFIRPASTMEDEDACEFEGDGQSIHFSLNIRHETSDDEYLRLISALAELVALRNELVHHFIERFDISTEAGCREASTYLDSRYETIDGAFVEMRGWAKTFAEAQVHLGQFIKSREFLDYLLHGIHPDGSGVDWPVSTIVKLLKSAETELRRNGWTPLNDAIALIRLREPEHTPKRYGCTSWRQVLHESRLFELRREKAVESSELNRFYYRSSTG